MYLINLFRYTVLVHHFFLLFFFSFDYTCQRKFFSSYFLVSYQRREAEASASHRQELLETAEEGAAASSERLEHANERRAAAEAKTADLIEKLAQVQAEAAVSAAEAEVRGGAGGTTRLYDVQRCSITCSARSCT